MAIKVVPVEPRGCIVELGRIDYIWLELSCRHQTKPWNISPSYDFPLLPRANACHPCFPNSEIFVIPQCMPRKRLILSRKFGTLACYDDQDVLQTSTSLRQALADKHSQGCAMR